MDTVLQVLSDEPVPPSRLQSKVPQDLETICLKCLEKEGGRRYASACDLADDLNHFQKGEPVSARPAGRLERGWRWCRRKPALAAASGLAVGAIFAALGVLVLYLFQLKDSANTLFVEKGKTEDALHEAQIQTVEAKLQTREAKRLIAIQMLERGLAFYDQQDAARAILWFTEGLRQAPADDFALQETIRYNWSNALHELVPLKAILAHSSPVHAVAFSPDGKLALTGAEDGNARLWVVATGEPYGPVMQHQRSVNAVAFTPDGRRVLTGSSDDAQFWSVATGQREGLPFCPGSLSLAFSPDGSLILIGRSDGTAQLWSVATRLPHGPALAPNVRSQVKAIAFSPDGKSFLIAGASQAQLWSTINFQRRGGPIDHGGTIEALAFSPDGQWILTAGDGGWRLWQAGAAPESGFRTSDNRAEYTVAATFSPDSQIILAGNGNGTASIAYNNEDNWFRAGNARPQHMNTIHTVAFSPDGKLALLTGSEDKTARLWSIHSVQRRNTPLLHRDMVKAVGFSADGKLAITGGDDTGAQIWSVPSGLPFGPRLQHESAVESVAFSPDGTLALTGSYDSTAQLWSVATGQPRGEPLKHLSPVTAVSFSPDGTRALTCSQDRTSPDLVGPDWQASRIAAQAP